MSHGKSRKLYAAPEKSRNENHDGLLRAEAVFFKSKRADQGKIGGREGTEYLAKNGKPAVKAPKNCGKGEA